MSRRLYAARWVLVCTAVLAGSVACGAPVVETAGSREPLEMGMLRAVPDDDHPAFLDELRRQGWPAGRDVMILPPDAGNTVYASEEEARAALIRWRDRGVDLVVAFSTPYARLAAEVMGDTPVLFVVNDPVAAGLVEDPRRPERHLTGVSFRSPADRTLDLATRAVGGATRVGYLWPEHDPAVPGHRGAVLQAARSLGLEVVEASFDDSESIGEAVASLAAAGAEVVLLANSTATFRALDELHVQLDRHGLPAAANTDFADFALVIVTPDGEELRRQLARQAARLLAGADVSAVPVEDPRKFTVIVNASKAEQLGLPPLDVDVLRQADVVR